MTRKWHQAIIPIAAIAGAQIPGMFSQPAQPAHSTSCAQMWGEAISNAWQGRETPTPAYSENEPTDAQNRATDPVAVAPSTSGTPATSVSPGVSAPRPVPSLTGMTQADWDNYRRYYAAPGAKNLGG